VLDRDEASGAGARRSTRGRCRPKTVALADALGRVLADDVRADVDVPGFDRANLDGFAVRAEDTFRRQRGGAAGGSGSMRRQFRPASRPVSRWPRAPRRRSPRAACCRAAPTRCSRSRTPDLEDAGATVVVRRARTPGAAVSFAGTDIGSGETVLFAGTRLTSRETGVLAAIGCAEVAAVRRPRVAILSTGGEIAQPGEKFGRHVYDSNGRILATRSRDRR